MNRISPHGAPDQNRQNRWSHTFHTKLPSPSNRWAWTASTRWMSRFTRFWTIAAFISMISKPHARYRN